MSRRKMKPLLWQTTNREVPCYFLGTMHLADTWYNVVPKNLLHTVDSCDVLCVEFNVLNASESQQETAGKELKRAVPRDILNKVVRKAKATKRRIEKSSRLTPKNSQLCGIDGFLMERADSTNKQIVSLETFKEQMQSIKASLPKIADISTDDPVEQVRSAFLSGDALFFEVMCGNVWGAEATSWCNRHIRMSKRLLDHLQKSPDKSFFVAIGAIHLLSPANVLEMIGLGGINTERI